jgi:hypothetical protein
MLTTRKLLLAVLSLAFCLAWPSKGSELYTFAYTALSGPVESFSFSFTSPEFATAGTSPVFDPFTVTDGTTSWTITQDLVELDVAPGVNEGCFQFGTPFADLSLGAPPILGPCSYGVGGPGDNQAAFQFVTSGLPTAPGIYTSIGSSGIFDTAGGVERIGQISSVDPTGTMTLDITDAPEPSGLGLVVAGLSVLCVLLVMKKSSSPLSRGRWMAS